MFLLQTTVKTLHIYILWIVNADGKSIHCHDAVHCRILPWNFAISIFVGIPKHTGGCIESSTNFLHDNTSDDVFEILLESMELFEAICHNSISPLINFLWTILAIIQSIVNSSTDNAFNVFDGEFSRFIGDFCHDLISTA